MEVPQVAAAPIFADVPDAEQQQTPTTTPTHDSAVPESSSATPVQPAAADSTLVCRKNLQHIFE